MVPNTTRMPVQNFTPLFGAPLVRSILLVDLDLAIEFIPTLAKYQALDSERKRANKYGMPCSSLVRVADRLNELFSKVLIKTVPRLRDGDLLSIGRESRSGKLVRISEEGWTSRLEPRPVDWFEGRCTLGSTEYYDVRVRNADPIDPATAALAFGEPSIVNEVLRRLSRGESKAAEELLQQLFVNLRKKVDRGQLIVVKGADGPHIELPDPLQRGWNDAPIVRSLSIDTDLQPVTRNGAMEVRNEGATSAAAVQAASKAPGKRAEALGLPAGPKPSGHRKSPDFTLWMLQEQLAILRGQSKPPGGPRQHFINGAARRVSKDANVNSAVDAFLGWSKGRDACEIAKWIDWLRQEMAPKR